MATYVNDLRLKEIGTGESSGTWGTETNTNLELIAEAFSFGTEAITTNADTHTTTIADGSTDPGRSIFLKYTGTLDSACTITIGPNTVSKLWFIENGTSGSQNIIISQGSGANITIPPGDVKAIYSDGAGSGAAMVDAFASLSVVDLKVQDDLTVTDDATIGGTLGVTGIVTLTDDLIIGDGKTIGSASDVDAMTIAANGQITLTQTLIGTALDISGDIDVDGTTNLDVVDIDGALTQDGGAVFNEDSADVDFRVESNGEANMLFVNGGDNTVLIGSSTSIANTAGTGALQVLGTGGGDTTLTIGRFSANASPPTLAFTKSRNATIGSNTIIQDGDNLGQIVFSASDGSDMLSSAAKIEVEVDGTPGANDLPGRIGFYTTPDGGTGSSERMRISNDGKIGIGVTAEQILHIKDTNNPGSTTGSVIIEGARDGIANCLEIRSRDASNPTGVLPINHGQAIRFTGFDGTDFEEMAMIGTIAEANVADGDAPSSLFFGTTKDSDGSASEHMRINNAGKVSIGTTTTDRELKVQKAGDHSIIAAVSGTSSLAGMVMGDTDDDDRGHVLYDNSSNSMGFRTNGSDKMKIPSTGHLVLEEGNGIHADSGRTGSVSVTDSMTNVLNFNTLGGVGAALGFYLVTAVRSGASVGTSIVLIIGVSTASAAIIYNTVMASGLTAEMSNDTLRLAMTSSGTIDMHVTAVPIGITGND